MQEFNVFYVGVAPLLLRGSRAEADKILPERGIADSVANSDLKRRTGIIPNRLDNESLITTFDFLDGIGLHLCLLSLLCERIFIFRILISEWRKKVLEASKSEGLSKYTKWCSWR